MTGPAGPAGPPDDDDLVPVSVRLGEVVPPEDPEDWTRPLTWVAALGMLAAPLMALAWFLAAPPGSAAWQPGTSLVAIALAGGAAGAGATQQGRLRAVAGTIVAGLFAALATIIVGAVLAGERPVGIAPPTLDHSVRASLAGLAGATVAAMVAPAFAAGNRRRLRWPVGGALGMLVAALAVPLVAP